MTDAPARPTRFADESWRTAMIMHSRVVGALIMRDMQTRFGSGYIGFLGGLVMPLGHLGIALVVMSILGRAPPIGTSVLTFLMTGILPFILWTYCHRQIMTALQQNRPLLYFPGVDVFDIVVARTIVEVANGTLVVGIVIAALAIAGQSVIPGDFNGFIICLAQAWLLGVATGLIFGSLGIIWIPILYAGGLLPPLFWIASGILYLPDAAPRQVRDVIFYLPMAQIVDGTRVAYFSEYYSSFHDTAILYIIMICLFAFGMALLPILRKIT